MTDPVIAVAAALSPAQRRDIVDRFVKMNPHMRGIDCATLLDMLGDHDSDLDVLESPAFAPLWASEDLRPYVGPSTRALRWITGDAPTSAAVKVLAEQARSGLTRG